MCEVSFCATTKIELFSCLLVVQMCEVFKVEFNGKIAAGKKLFDKFSDDSMSKPFQVPCFCGHFEMSSADR